MPPLNIKGSDPFMFVGWSTIRYVEQRRRVLDRLPGRRRRAAGHRPRACWACSFQPGWEWPALASFYRRLASLGRLILFDKRGTGLSDRVLGIASLEERMDDVRAVMDAAAVERAVVLGVSEGGPMCALFAATHPARTLALVTMGA